MEHLTLHCNLTLIDFCNRLAALLNLPDFTFDAENETEWGETKRNDLTVNISRPYEAGTLQEWDDTVPSGCNFGISMTKKNMDQKEIQQIGELIANEFNEVVYHHRTWLTPGENVKRELEMKPKTKLPSADSNILNKNSTYEQTVDFSPFYGLQFCSFGGSV